MDDNLGILANTALGKQQQQQRQQQGILAKQQQQDNDQSKEKEERRKMQRREQCKRRRQRLNAEREANKNKIAALSQKYVDKEKEVKALAAKAATQEVELERIRTGATSSSEVVDSMSSEIMASRKESEKDKAFDILKCHNCGEVVATFIMSCCGAVKLCSTCTPSPSDEACLGCGMAFPIRQVQALKVSLTWG